MPQSRAHDYEIDAKTYQAFIAHGDKPAPGVLVFHAWGGRSEFENTKASALASLGYTGVAVDLFGKGVLGQSADENGKLIEPFVTDRPMLQEKLAENIAMARALPEVASGKLAAVGYCFGGLCALDIARSGGNVDGVVSFHGLLGPPGNTINKINAKILALHGWDDPMAPPADVSALGAELNKAGADWQLHAYGGTMHAFTNPAANDPDFGTVYNANADRRAWQAMSNFLGEVLG